MSRVLANNSAYAFADEESVGTLPASPTWYSVEPNTVSKAGAEVTVVSRSPLSKNRQNRKGGVVDLDSSWEAEIDMVMEHLRYLVPRAMYTRWVGPATFVVTGVTTTGYTVASGGALPANTLIVAAGFANDENNSTETFKVVGSSSTSTEIKTSGLVTESSIPAAQNATVTVAGVRGASGDIEIDVTAGVTQIRSTSLDFTTLNLHVGQFLWVGGDTAHAFADANNRGFARIRTIAAHEMTIDKLGTTFASDNGSGKTIDLYFGPWCRNVSVDHTDYLETSIQVETQYTDLAAVGTPLWTYAKGGLINMLTMAFKGQDKGTMTLELVGTTTTTPSSTRATNASAPIAPVRVSMINTASDLSRLRVTEVDETGITSDFTELSLSFGNNVAPEKTLGVLGARYMNSGNFDAKGDSKIVLTDKAVMEAVRDNRLLTMEIAFRSAQDGAMLIDLPSITLGGGAPDFAKNESVKVPLSIEAVQDTTFGYTSSVSYFPYLPAA